MSDVFNWQLGREMSYPYDESHPDSQFAFVFNINRCIACQTCTMACKSTWTFSKGQEFMWWNNVETKPYGGYPLNWDVKLLGMLEKTNPGGQTWDTFEKSAEKPFGLFEGNTIFEAADKDPSADASRRALGYLPTDQEWQNPNIHEETASGKVMKEGEWGRSTQLPEHDVWFFYLQRLCNHCSYPACLAACPRKAIYKRKEDGIVLIDQKRCRGYRKCVEACPYKKSLYRPTTRVSEKCIGCYPRIEGKDPELSPNGEPLETRCMASCVGKIRLQGLVRIKDGEWDPMPDNPLYYLIKERKIALPLYPQFGTQANGYYIPPRWVPKGYLEQMFGPGVEDALALYSCPDRELLAVLQLFRSTQQIIEKFKIKKGPKLAEIERTLPSGEKKVQEIYNDTVIGYNTHGKEVVRATTEQPAFERSKEHLNSI
ncbi:MAG: nitrate oxidoreductase subunit beta [Kiritimatiellia bacterium]|jgi:nitrate reductase beta subunit|nr:nitrate oxidoreductase subunit beta [Kiritimatiellia bacterium]MDP6630430.1 nitrate oxidoreductase subunit beta [Kiritimatiellia bacterium]MDP6809887.1 nitrate oxidoreductase subunit beta [Kiritimatiellia bacterium]MDP7024279.1 nitrate oxidoreductase subunit beta [Kiritimatiellia bacterium]